MDSPATRAVELWPRSRAERAGIEALFDVGAVIEASPYPPSKFRLIGGQMVTLLIRSRGLEQAVAPRMSLDADFGAFIPTVRGASLDEELARRGYQWIEGRYRRALGDGLTAIIDLLIPAQTGRRKRSKNVDGRELFETQGLADVLNNPGVELELRGRGRGDERRTTLVLPDERGALLVKTHAWLDRSAGKDAGDVARCLELCARAKVTKHDWSGPYASAREELRGPLNEEFCRGGRGARAAVKELGLRDPDAIAARTTRLAALVRRVIG